MKINSPAQDSRGHTWCGSSRKLLECLSSLIPSTTEAATLAYFKLQQNDCWPHGCQLDIDQINWEHFSDRPAIIARDRTDTMSRTNSHVATVYDLRWRSRWWYCRGWWDNIDEVEYELASLLMIFMWCLYYVPSDTFSKFPCDNLCTEKWR